MRLPFVSRQRRVELTSAAETPVRLRWLAARYVAGAGVSHARGIMNALLRDQRLPHDERRRWIAHLFDGAPQPEPFALTGEQYGPDTEAGSR